MKINAHPKWLEKLEKSALNSVSLNERRTIDGTDEIISNPAYDGISDSEIANEVNAILDRHSLTDYLRKIEDSNLLKFGPRSIAKPWVDRKETLYDYFGKTDYNPGSFDTNSGRLRRASLSTVRENLLKSSSASLPYMKKKGLVLDEAVNDIESQEEVFPCMLYTRTQEDAKTRNVWGYPISDTMREQQFFIPYLTYERKLRHRSALVGPDSVDDAVTKLLISKGPSDLVMSVDFSSYDATINPEHVYEAFNAIASEFQSDCHDPLYRVFRRFVTIPIYTPDGEVVGPHGVPSGSSFTNTIDSIVQFAASGGKYDCQVQGDDGLYVVPEGDHDLLYDRFKNYGLSVNEDKSDVFNEREAVFLQRYYHPDYLNRTGTGLGGIYSIARALARIKYLERWTNFEAMDIGGSDFFALRTITILENCKHHPAFEDLVKYVRDLDKHQLKFTEGGLSAYSRSMESKARAGVFNQYGLQRGIHAFETVKLLKTL